MIKKISVFCSAILCFLLPIHKAAAQKDTAFKSIVNKWAVAGSNGNYDSALFYAQEAQRYAENKWGILDFNNANALANMVGYTYSLMGNVSEAYPYYKKGLAICDSIDNSIVHVNNKATLYDTLAINKDTTLTWFFVVTWGIALEHFGLLCRDAGAYTESQTFLLKSLPLSKKTASWTQYTECLINIGINYEYFGEYAKAQLMYDSTIQTIDTLPKTTYNIYVKGSICNNIADICSNTGNPGKALIYANKAEDIFNANNLQNAQGGQYFQNYIQVIINVADAYKNLSNTDSAMLKCLQAEDSIKNKKDDYSNANILQEEAAIYAEKNRVDTAIRLFKLCLHIMDTLPQRPDLYDPAAINLATIYQQTGQYAAADSIFRKEISYLNGNGFTASYNMQQAMAGLCKSLLYQNKNQEAADSLVKLGKLALHVLAENFAGMPEADKMRYAAAFDGIFDMLYTLLQKGDDINPNIKSLAFALQLLRKNMVLTSQVTLLNRLRLTGNSDTALANAFSAWLNTRQMLAKQFSLPQHDRVMNTDSLQQVSETLEKLVSAKGYSTGFMAGGNAIPAFLQQDKNTADIEFVRYNYLAKDATGNNAIYGAFILKGGDSVPAFVSLCTEQAIVRLMKDPKGNSIGDADLTQKLYTPDFATATTLYKFIWQPVERHLHGATVANYSPAGLLNNIAFGALCKGKSHLANSYTLHCFASLAAGHANTVDTAPPSEISLWGNMDYDRCGYTGGIAGGSKAPSLDAPFTEPGTQVKDITKNRIDPIYTDEISAIKKIFAGKAQYSSIENQYATEDSFKQQAPKIKGVLHISTHGFYTPYNKGETESKLPGSFIAANANPLFRCWLAFAGANYYWTKGAPRQGRDDGILTGYEVSQLDLHNVPLVTLSACETGLGDITATEGNIGLQRAFKLAGVQNLLVSLWHVPAKQTAELLPKFYKYWLGGKTPAAALRAAEKDLQKLGYPPYYWAGFVLVE